MNNILSPDGVSDSTKIRRLIESMMDSKSVIKNYVLPGLESYLISDNGERGKIRMFHCTRNHHEVIIPHSHRFDIASLVLTGSVTNEIWQKETGTFSGNDLYVPVLLEYAGQAGTYASKSEGEAASYRKTAKNYGEGQWYYMSAADIHSIRFSKGAKVLFFEGPQVSDSSVYLEPFVDGKMVETFDVKPWMFQKGV